MTIFLLMSLINITLSTVLMWQSISKLRQITCPLTNQTVSSTVFIALAMMVLHCISALNHNQYSVTDVVDGAWRVVDMLATIIMIKLVTNLKE